MPDDAIERARARELLKRAFLARSIGYVDLPTSNLVSIACAIDALLLAFASQQAPEGWRPIETAPKDGTPFDVWMPSDQGGYRIHDLRFYAGKLCRGYVPCDYLSRWPTHWRPLPAPPAMLDAAPSVTLGEVG